MLMLLGEQELEGSAVWHVTRSLLSTVIKDDSD